MPYSTLQAARSHVEKLMDIAVTLADFTQADQVADRLPASLARALDLANISFALIRTPDAPAGDAAPHILLSGFTGPFAPADAAAFPTHFLALLRHSAPNASPTLRISDPALETTFTEITLSDLPAFPRALVFGRSIDNDTRMLLTVHLAPDAPRVSPAQLDALYHTASQLAKLLRCLFTWQAHPEILGPAFERLTEREWVVLRGLNSDAGEKQLADQLSLSPHTLHSHIKSIYRKVGVQGRLPLLLRLNAALREFRAATLQQSPVSTHHTQQSRAAQRPLAAYA